MFDLRKLSEVLKSFLGIKRKGERVKEEQTERKNMSVHRDKAGLRRGQSL